MYCTVPSVSPESCPLKRGEIRTLRDSDGSMMDIWSKSWQIFKTSWKGKLWPKCPLVLHLYHSPSVLYMYRDRSSITQFDLYRQSLICILEIPLRFQRLRSKLTNITSKLTVSTTTSHFSLALPCQSPHGFGFDFESSHSVQSTNLWPHAQTTQPAYQHPSEINQLGRSYYSRVHVSLYYLIESKLAWWLRVNSVTNGVIPSLSDCVVDLLTLAITKTQARSYIPTPNQSLPSTVQLVFDRVQLLRWYILTVPSTWSCSLLKHIKLGPLTQNSKSIHLHSWCTYFKSSSTFSLFLHCLNLSIFSIPARHPFILSSFFFFFPFPTKKKKLSYPLCLRNLCLSLTFYFSSCLLLINKTISTALKPRTLYLNVSDPFFLPSFHPHQSSPPGAFPGLRLWTRNRHSRDLSRPLHPQHQVDQHWLSQPLTSHCLLLSWLPFLHINADEDASILWSYSYNSLRTSVSVPCTSHSRQPRSVSGTIPSCSSPLPLAHRACGHRRIYNCVCV